MDSHSTADHRVLPAFSQAGAYPVAGIPEATPLGGSYVGAKAKEPKKNTSVVTDNNAVAPTPPEPPGNTTSDASVVPTRQSRQLEHPPAISSAASRTIQRSPAPVAKAAAGNNRTKQPTVGKSAAQGSQGPAVPPAKDVPSSAAPEVNSAAGQGRGAGVVPPRPARPKIKVRRMPAATEGLQRKAGVMPGDARNKLVKAALEGGTPETGIVAEQDTSPQRLQPPKDDAERIAWPDAETAAPAPAASPVVTAVPDIMPPSVPRLAVPAVAQPRAGGQAGRTPAAPQVHIGQVNVVVREAPEQKPVSGARETGSETTALQLLRGL